MKKSAQIEFENELIKSYVSGEIAVIKVKCDAFKTISNLEQVNTVLPWFDAVEHDENIKGVLAVSEKNCVGEKPYEAFLSEITGKEISNESDKTVDKFEKQEIRAIEINTLVNLIRKVMLFKKVFIASINGEIVTPFFGIALASDFRIGSEDMKILFSHVKYGLHPSGAVPLLLPEFINRQLAVNYLIRGGEINGKKALELNLVNELLPNENFEENCLKKAGAYCSSGMNFIKNSKSLINRKIKEFEEYVQLEANYTYK